MRIEISSSGFGGAAVSELQSDLGSYIGDAESVLSSFKTIKESTIGLNGGAGNLQGALENVDSRVRTEEGKIQEAKTIQKKVNEFVSLASRIDQSVSEKVNSNKEELYRVNPWLKPATSVDEEVPWYEQAWNWLCGAGEAITDGAKQVWNWVSDTATKAWKGIVEFYQEYKKIIDTVLIVVGAVLAVVAVIGSGGLALVPLLGALGLSTAAATAISTIVAVVAVVSTVVAAGMNIADTWLEIDSPMFNTVQKVLNITSTVTNLAYSIGNIYNSIKGVTPEEYIARQNAIKNGKQGYGNLDAEHPRMEHTNSDYDAQRKKAIYDENMKRNGGELRSDQTGKKLEMPKRSEKGVTPPANEAQVDHIYPQSQGGLNSFDNAQVIEREANRHKSDLLIFVDYDKYSVPDTTNWKNFFINIFEGGAATSQTAPRIGDN